MDFWNDDMAFITPKKKKWTQKVCYNNVKTKFFKSPVNEEFKYKMLKNS
jgi:hypothetical protein